MAQKTLNTVIALSGRIDNSFGAIGEALLGMGNQLDALSQKVIDFGRKGIEEFASYDDVMREVQALGEYDERTIRALDAYNQSIAQTSRYTMEQAGKAEVMMAQLGLNMEQTRTLMPTVMNLATAANIDLADSLDYLYYTLNALGEPMDYANVLSDQMAKTAAISAADIDTLGQSMQRLGSGAQFFAGGSSEILAILGGISQFGSDMQGTDAGTQLRNFMLTLLAPTQSKDKLIQSLRVSEEEWAEFETYMEDAGIDVNSTAEAMNELGLSVYGSTTGELKPAIQIIGELNAALLTLSDEDKNKTLGNLFGKRTTTTALNLIASLSTIIDYQKQIEDGSAGYTQTMADTIEGGIGGTMRAFSAAWNRFEVRTGQTLSPKIQSAADGLTSIVNSLNTMDDGMMNALVSGASVIAAAGPGILAAGAAFRLLGYILTPAGAFGLGVTALVAAAAAVKELQEASMADNFGTMELDSESISQYVTSLSEGFKAGYTEINAFSDAVDAAAQSYKTASETFSSDLLTAMLTGATLSEPEKKSLKSLGGEMHAALLDGIKNSTAASESYWEMLFGGEGTAETDPNYRDIIGTTNTAYLNAISEAEAIGMGLRRALNKAFEDGKISREEYENIQSYMKSYNEAMAKAAADAKNEEDYVNMQILLRKAETASLESIRSMAQAVEEERDSVLADAEDRYLREYFKLQYNGASREELDAAQEEYDAYVTAQNAQYDGILLKMWESSVKSSDLSGAYEALGVYADQYLAGVLSADTIHSAIKDLYGNNKYAGEIDAFADNVSTQLGEILIRTIASLGGYEGIAKKIEYYEANGDTKSAAELRRIAAMERLLNDFAETGVRSDTLLGLFDGEIYSEQVIGTKKKNRESFEAEMSGSDAGYTLDTARQTVEALGDEKGSLAGLMEEIGHVVSGEDGYSATNISGYRLSKNAEDELTRMYTQLSGLYDLDAVARDMGKAFAENGISDYYATWSLLYGQASANEGKYRISADTGEGDAASMAINMPDGAADATVYTSAFQGALDENIPAASVTPPSGQADGLSYATGFQDALNAHPASMRVRRPGAAAPAAVNTMSLYAEGGRATIPSIFGEAGPEWAIPEEHTARVASLLNAAREAAGFTWPELLARNGGLNAGGAAQTQIVYSPTIIAGDARGVEQKLIEDKARLDRWWREKRIREEVEVYV